VSRDVACKLWTYISLGRLGPAKSLDPVTDIIIRRRYVPLPISVLLVCSVNDRLRSLMWWRRQVQTSADLTALTIRFEPCCGTQPASRGEFIPSEKQRLVPVCRRVSASHSTLSNANDTVEFLASGIALCHQVCANIKTHTLNTSLKTNRERHIYRCELQDT
jgi:hypothetical protein